MKKLIETEAIMRIEAIKQEYKNWFDHDLDLLTLSSILRMHLNDLLAKFRELHLSGLDAIQTNDLLHFINPTQATHSEIKEDEPAKTHGTGKTGKASGKTSKTDDAGAGKHIVEGPGPHPEV